ncbi:MAG: hypothetical protein WBN81_15025 [Gammaproteobacteria bacterium]
MFAEAVSRVVARALSLVLLSLLLAAPIAVAAESVVAKTIFLVDEDDRIVAANTATGQFFSLTLHAKEKIRQRHVANGVAVLVTNQRFAGVGSYPSGWSSLRRIADEQVVSAEVVDKSALLVTSDRILTFNGESGSWAETRR